MQVKQIADILNNVYSEVIGESALIQEDLSNIVDVGRVITQDDSWGDNFDNYVKSIIDKVGQSIYWSRDYKGGAPNILQDSYKYGSILEKIRCDVGDYRENQEWELSDETEFDVFGFVPPSVTANYFNKLTTFTLKISITEKQARSAFNSAADMNSFISMIENRISMKMRLATDSLIYRTIVNLIGEKINGGKGVVHLLTDYNSNHSGTLTQANAMTDPDFLKYASMTMSMYKTYMANASTLFNNGGYVTFTPADRLKFVVQSEFAKAMEVNLYADTYHNEFVKLPGYTEVPYWQGSGEAGSFADRTTINCVTASDSTPVNQAYILGVMFDEWAAMVCNRDPSTRSIFNPEGNFYNYWHSFDASYYNDLNENCVVFILD